MIVRAALLAALGCGGPPPEPVAEAPSEPSAARVVTLGAGLTEVVGALDPSVLVGVDSSSTWPASVKDLPTVGYNRRVTAEGVLALSPTLVIASDDSGPPAAIDQLRASGVRVEILELARDIDDVRDRIARVGELLGRTEEAAALRARFDADCERLAAASWTDRPRAMFIYASSGGNLNVSGTGTAGDAILALAGIENVVDGYEGYRPFTPEAAVQASPDWLILTDRGLAAAGGTEALRQRPGLALTPAARDGRVASADDLVLLGFGPRTCAGALALGQEVREP